MNFEEELKKQILQSVKKKIETITPFFSNKDNYSNYTTEIMEHLMRLIDKYESKYAVNKYKKIEELLKENNLSKIYQETEFSKEEIDSIKYVLLTGDWNGKYFDDEKKPIIDILIKKIIIKEYGEDSIEKFLKIIDENDNQREAAYLKHIKGVLSGELLREKSSKLEEAINSKVERNFNDRMNCGGYAFKIDTCIFPFGYKDFSKNVSTILNKFSFVRLLGAEPLKEDEYIVLYRANKNGKGHHFIRIDDDGTVREKNESKAPRIFEDWGSLEDAKEAVFAVKKEHEMFGYSMLEVNKNEDEGFNFEESVEAAIKQKENTFNYHGNNYSLKKTENGEIRVICNENIVAEVYVDDEECIVDTYKDKEDLVENLQPPVPIVIENGKFINKEQFISRKDLIEEENER